MVEQFSKWVEIVPLSVKNAAMSAYAFHHNVIARDGAPAEVITDGGPEFEAEFHQLLVDCLIDHRHITPGSPQGNGLAERRFRR